MGKSDNPKKMWYYELWKKFKEEHPDKIEYITRFEDTNKSIFELYQNKIL